MGKRDAIVSDELASKFATEKDTPYTRWVENEGLDIIGAHYVRGLVWRVRLALLGVIVLLIVLNAVGVLKLF